MEAVLHDDSAGLALGDRPSSPADEAVDRIAATRFVKRELVPLALELVAAVLQPVRPWHQDLPSSRGAHLVDPVSIEDVATRCRVLTEAAPDFHDHSALIAEHDLDLLA
jgi:hypothetical protein